MWYNILVESEDIMKKKWIVYMYVFPNRKRYIGATSRSLAARQGKDFKKYKNCKSIWSAIEKYGYQNITQRILFEGELEADEAGEMEKYFIAKYDTTNPKKGYNTNKGGEGMTKHITEERKEQLRKQILELGYKNSKRVVSAETREKQRLAKLGTKRGAMSEETKRKISVANSRENMSEETHLRRSLAKQKKVIVINPETDKTVIFDSQTEVAKYYGVRESAVSRWIDGTRKPRNKCIFKFYSPTTTE